MPHEILALLTTAPSGTNLAAYSPVAGDTVTGFTNPLAIDGLLMIGHSDNVGYVCNAGGYNAVYTETGITPSSNAAIIAVDITIDITSVEGSGLVFGFTDSSHFFSLHVNASTGLAYITNFGTSTDLASGTISVSDAKYTLQATTTGGGSPTISLAWGLAGGSLTPITGMQNIAAAGLVVAGKPIGLTCYAGVSKNIFTNLREDPVGSGPTSIMLSGANAGTVGTASGTITATLDQSALVSTSVALTVATITGTFTTSPVVIGIGQTTGTFTFDASSAGTGLISGASSGLTTGTLAFTASLAAPAITATAGNLQITIGETGSLPAGATGLNIYQGTTSGGESGTAVAINVTAPHILTGLTASQIYYYKAKATDGTNLSAYSSEVSATPTASPATTLTLSTSPASTMAVNTGLTAYATPNGTATGTATITPSGSASTGLTAQTVTFSGGSIALSANFTPTVTGSLILTLTTATGLTVAGSPITITVSSLVTFVTGIAPVASGTPTLAVYNPDQSAASYTGGTPEEIASTGVWTAEFLAAPGVYLCLWTMAGITYSEYATPTTAPAAGLTLTQLDAALASGITVLAGGSSVSLPTGTVAAGSTGASVVVAGLLASKSFVGQRLYHYPSGECRTIGGQAFGGGNYTFAFIGSAGTESGPYSAVTTGDTVSPTP